MTTYCVLCSYDKTTKTRIKNRERLSDSQYGQKRAEVLLLSQFLYDKHQTWEMLVMKHNCVT